MRFPLKCVVDTNVPVVADLATHSDENSDVPEECILICVDAIEHVIEKDALVIDEGGEIFKEYMGTLYGEKNWSLVGKFMKWVFRNLYRLPDSQRVKITKEGASYKEFPTHAELQNFDPDDMKFVAVANAHPQKPPILQAVDSEWWRYKDALKEAGITVNFLCPEYVKGKHQRKQRK